VNESDLLHGRWAEAIRFGLARHQKRGENTPRRSGISRRSHGDFRSYNDFCERIESRFLNKRVSKALSDPAQWDSLGPREGMLASVDYALVALQRASRVRDFGPAWLVSDGRAPAPVPFERREAEPWSEEERLPSEYPCWLYVSGTACKVCGALQELKTVSLGVNLNRGGIAMRLLSPLIVGVRAMRSRRGARWVSAPFRT